MLPGRRLTLAERGGYRLPAGSFPWGAADRGAGRPVSGDGVAGTAPEPVTVAAALPGARRPPWPSAPPATA